MTKQEKVQLENFLQYLQDKVEDCYKKETKGSIDNYLDSIELVKERLSPSS